MRTTLNEGLIRADIWCAKAVPGGISPVSGGGRHPCALVRLDTGADATPQVALGDVEGREEAHCLIVRAAGAQQHIAPERSGARGTRSCLRIGVDREHR